MAKTLQLKTQLKTSAVLIIGSMLLYGCVTRPTHPKSADVYDTERPPVEAPQALKINDFRLNPPTVLDVTVKRLNAEQDLLAVRFAPDERLGATVTLHPDESSPTVLRNDGRAGDAKAADGIYSAIVPTEWDSLAGEQDRLLAELARHKSPLTVPMFRGREVVGEQKIDVEELARLRARGIIKLPPFGAGGPLVVADKCLFITDPSVVGDAGRTFDPCTGAGTPMGKWTFGYLMTAMANQPVTGNDPADFVFNWLQTWMTNEPVNGFTVPRRVQMQRFIDNWPKQANGKLDLAHAPVKLSAIVNRIDLAANSAYGAAGGAEGRFVFTVYGSGTNSPIPGTNQCSLDAFTIIFEYGVPIKRCTDIRDWANQWLNLQTNLLGSSAYNAGLEAITERFAAANANPAKPNGSALDQLRTDEFALSTFPWELREFHVETNHQLNEVTVKQTPDRITYNAGNPTPAGAQAANLAAWMNQNTAAISNNTYTVPDTLPTGPFLGGSSLNSGNDAWNAPGIIAGEHNRHIFSGNTCNGCHGGETHTSFLHVDQRPHPNGAAQLSEFLTGSTQPFTVPVTGNPTYANNPGDLARRAQILAEDAAANCQIIIRVPVLLTTH